MLKSLFSFLSGRTWAIVRDGLAAAGVTSAAALAPQAAFAQAAADPTTVVEQTRISASGQASNIDARAATASQSSAGGSVGYGPFSARGGTSRSSNGATTRVRTGASYIEAATVRGSQIEANGTLSNARAENATVDVGVSAIGKTANN